MTLLLSAVAVPINTVFGVTSAILIARNEFPGKLVIVSMLDLPFSISPVVTGGCHCFSLHQSACLVKTSGTSCFAQSCHALLTLSVQSRHCHFSEVWSRKPIACHLTAQHVCYMHKTVATGVQQCTAQSCNPLSQPRRLSCSSPTAC